MNDIAKQMETLTQMKTWFPITVHSDVLIQMWSNMQLDSILIIVHELRTVTIWLHVFESFRRPILNIKISNQT